MKTIKSTVAAILICASQRLVSLWLIIFLNHLCYAQDISYGAKVSLGTGYLKTKNLTAYFDSEVINEKCVKKYTLTGKMGFAFAIGGFAEYSINDNIAVLGEMNFQSVNAKLEINYIQDKEKREITNSVNKFTISSLNIPLLAKYYFSGAMGPYATAGFGFDFVMKAKLKTDETETEETYTSSGVFVTSVDKSTSSTTADMNGFKKFRMSFGLGGGILLDAGKNGISVDLRYSLPLTKSEMYTSSTSFDDLTEKSDIFGIIEKTDIENDGYRLDDFKMGVLMLSVGYRL